MNYLSFQSLDFECTLYLMKVIPIFRFWVYIVPDEGYWAYLMKFIEHCTWWRLFQKRVVHTKFDIKICFYCKKKKVQIVSSLFVGY